MIERIDRLCCHTALNLFGFAYTGLKISYEDKKVSQVFLFRNERMVSGNEHISREGLIIPIKISLKNIFKLQVANIVRFYKLISNIPK